MSNRITNFIVACLLSLSFFSCSDAEDFYDEQESMPEIRANYALVYMTGDSMTVEGRLNPDKGLQITVGGTNANYKVLRLREQVEPDAINKSMDMVRFEITEAMGTGQQAVTISSGGNTINVPAIEIISSKPHIPGTLVMERISGIAPQDAVFFCRNGKGDIYVYRSSGNKIEHIKKDGTTETILVLESRSDAYSNGTWAVHTMYAGGVDKSGENIWFSARTTDQSTSNTGNQIYRLFHYNTVTKELTTLNRSLYPNRTDNRSLATLKPFEGSIGDVKIFRVGGIYPDNKGNAYIRLAGYAFCLLEQAADPASAQFGYLLRNSGGDWFPEIPGYTNKEDLAILMPGTSGSTNTDLIDPEEGLQYFTDIPQPGSNLARTRINLYNFHTRSLLFSYEKETFDGRDGRKYPAGPFSVITGVNYAGNRDTDFDQAGFMPMPGKKLLLLNYGTTYTVMDFERKYADLYAAKLEISLKLKTNDIGLNYDEEGMIYTTSGGRTMISRTKIKQ